MTIPRLADGSLDPAAFDDPPGVTIYAQGLCFASVCSALPVDVVDAAMRAYPSGVSSPWTRSPSPTFANGGPNPCPCENLPGHTHYLYEC